MSERVVYRVRDIVNGAWKIHKVFGNPESGPMEWSTRRAAKAAARYLKRWRIVKVTIRRRPTSASPAGGGKTEP